MLSHNNTTSAVRGINELQAEAEARHGPGNYIPPVAWVYWSFRVMVGLGTVFILVTAWGLLNWWRRRLETDRLWQRVAVATIALPFVANTAGWMVAEMGRQPWVVYGLLRTADGVSPIVGAGSIWISMVGFTLVYGLLAGVGAFLILQYREARSGVARARRRPRTSHAY